MNKALILFGAWFLAGVSLFGQSVISETRMIGPDGQLASGTLRIWPSAAFETPTGLRIETVQSAVPIVNGRFTVALWPNPANTFYYVRWQLNGAAPRLELWNVPACSSVLTVAQVEAIVSNIAGVLTVRSNDSNCNNNPMTWDMETQTWNACSGTWSQQ